MPYFVVDSFPGGLDLRKPEWALPAGSASVAENVHLTRGNDWEGRKAFVPEYTLPVGQTVGLATVNEQPYVFGTATRPATLDVAFQYQQLAHPTNPGALLTRITSWDVYDGKLYLAAQFDDGKVYHYYDGIYVAAWADGRARGAVEITAGTGGTSLTSLRVNGVEALSTAVNWATSNSATATAVANQINAFTSTPDYTATSVGQFVYVVAGAAAADTINDATITTTVSGAMTVAVTSNMAGGTTLAGTYVPGSFVLTYDSKVYSTSGPRLHFSSVRTPIQWNPDYPGAGFVTIANHTSGAADLTGIGVYLADMAIFTDKAIQVWNVEADDTNNARKQTIGTYGTRSPRSIRQYGDTGLMFLDRKGIRALQPSSTLANYALVDDVGSQIDELILPRMAAMSDDTIARAFALVEPVDNRFLLFLADRAYVYTRFPSNRVFGWSEYILGFTPDEGAVIGNRMWVRAGNVVYVYGGLNGTTYDATVPRLRLPNLSAAAPATFKTFSGMDIGAVGEWEIRQQYEINDTATDLASIVTGPTFDGPAISTIGWQTSPTIELIGRGSEYKRLVSVILHFDKNVAE